MSIYKFNYLFVNEYVTLTVDDLKFLIPQEIRKLCLFACYSNSNELQNSYFYCNELKNYFDLVIIITNERIITKIPNKCKIIFVPNYNRDFGLWWRVTTNLKQSRSVPLEMLGLVNDSCELLSGLQDVFSTGLNNGWKFWGISDCTAYTHHIQSFFVIFHYDAIDWFFEFVKELNMKDVGTLFRFQVVVRCEFALSEFMRKKYEINSLYHFDDIIKIDSTYNTGCHRSGVYFMWDRMLSLGCPVLKKTRAHYHNESTLINVNRKTWIY